MFRGGDRRGRLLERQLHQERLLRRLLVRARWEHSKRRPRPGPHLNGPGPRVVVGGPRGAPVAGLLAGGLAAGGLPAVLLLSGAAALAAAALGRRRGRGAPGVGATWAHRLGGCSRRRAGGRQRRGLRGCLGSIVISSRRRSALASRKVGKGRPRRRCMPTFLNRSFKPRMTWRTRVRSETTSPRAPSYSAIFFNSLQYSVIDKSPWIKLQSLVSRRSARVSRLLKNCDSMVHEQCGWWSASPRSSRRGRRRWCRESMS